MGKRRGKRAISVRLDERDHARLRRVAISPTDAVKTLLDGASAARGTMTEAEFEEALLLVCKALDILREGGTYDQVIDRLGAHLDHLLNIRSSMRGGTA